MDQKKLDGVNARYGNNTEGQSLTLVYVDGTRGWKTVKDSTQT